MRAPSGSTSWPPAAARRSRSSGSRLRRPDVAATDVQQQLHIDFQVGDLDAAHDRAVDLGARLLDTQPTFRVSPTRSATPSASAGLTRTSERPRGSHRDPPQIVSSWAGDRARPGQPSAGDDEVLGRLRGRRLVAVGTRLDAADLARPRARGAPSSRRSSRGRVAPRPEVDLGDAAGRDRGPRCARGTRRWRRRTSRPSW